MMSLVFGRCSAAPFDGQQIPDCLSCTISIRWCCCYCYWWLGATKFMTIAKYQLTIQNVHGHRKFMRWINGTSVVAGIWFIYFGYEQSWIGAFVQYFGFHAAKWFGWCLIFFVVVVKLEEKKREKNVCFIFCWNMFTCLVCFLHRFVFCFLPFSWLMSGASKHRYHYTSFGRCIRLWRFVHHQHWVQMQQ